MPKNTTNPTPSARSPRRRPRGSGSFTVAIVTGTRAEFGLLRPVMDAIKKHKKLKLQVIAAGAHFLSPAKTIREVEAAYAIAARVPMQRAGTSGRSADAQALGRGVSGFAKAFAKLNPDWVVVLGDRIEAFAAASAASIAGIAVCHIHGGDRAEGIADEAMRHAITKLSHLHCAATTLSADRLQKMGEKPEHVHVTGSPAIDGLSTIKPMSDADAAKLGDPRAVILLHPSGDPQSDLRWSKLALLKAQVVAEADPYATTPGGHRNILCLQPNADPGHEAIRLIWSSAASAEAHVLNHLSRDRFLSLLKRLATRRNGRALGALIGNSSAGLIEAAALGVVVMNLGPRQNGRERASTVIDIPQLLIGSSVAHDRLIRAAMASKPRSKHPYGNGRAGPRIAALLAKLNPHASSLLRKHNSY